VIIGVDDAHLLDEFSAVLVHQVVLRRSVSAVLTLRSGERVQCADREREIVTLAAGGLSNRQIAQRLVVSVRTVENHLYRACAKIGASDRVELAAVLRGH
jgi:DNA-binding CsgD family transcriptional regulator